MLKLELERIKKLQSSDFSLAETQKEVFSIIETLCTIIIDLQEENRELKDEINRLKGEKGNPLFKAMKKEPETSPEKASMDTATKKTRTKSCKTEKIKIDRTETVRVDRSTLPEDAEFKGYEEKIVQNIILKTDNVLYRLEKYYSPSLGKTYTAEVSESIKNTEFGAETKALISTLYYENRVTENKIASFLNANGLHISEGTISNILIKGESEKLTEVKNEIFEAGLSSSTYQQIDDTGMKIAGKNAYATIVCNEKYSAFFINSSKSRETVKSFMTALLASLFIVLVGDDPIFDCHREILSRVRKEIWDYYKKLIDYKQNPAREKYFALRDGFDRIFEQKTGYEELDKRLELTLAKKQELLTVLDYPEVPLHNNLSENGIREIVMKRKISGGVKTDDGVKAWENNMSILATCKKLGVSFLDFMKGVFDKNINFNLPDLILQKQD